MSRQPESQLSLVPSQQGSCATLQAGLVQVSNQSQATLGGESIVDEESALEKELKDILHNQLMASSY